jgi:hypothetical protein
VVFGAFSEPALKSAMRLAVRAIGRRRQRKSNAAVTGEVPTQLLATCTGDRLADIREAGDCAHGVGVRQRSELANLRVGSLADQDPLQADPSDPDSPPLPCFTIRLGSTKTTASKTTSTR